MRGLGGGTGREAGGGEMTDSGFVEKETFWEFREDVNGKLAKLDNRSTRTETLYEVIHRDMTDVRAGQKAMNEGMALLAQKLERVSTPSTPQQNTLPVPYIPPLPRSGGILPWGVAFISFAYAAHMAVKQFGF